MKNLLSSVWKSLFDPFGDKERQKIPTPVVPIEVPIAVQIEEQTSREILENESEDYAGYARAFDEELAKCTTIAELVELYNLLCEKSQYRLKILEIITADTVATYADYVDLYSDISDSTALTRLLFTKAVALAVKPEDYIRLHELARDYDDRDIEYLEKAIEALYWSKEQWEKLSKLAGDDSNFRALDCIADCKLVAFYNNVPDLLEHILDYLKNYETDVAVLKVMYEKLFGLATRQELQVIEKFASVTDEYQELAEKVGEFLKK